MRRDSDEQMDRDFDQWNQGQLAGRREMLAEVVERLRDMAWRDEMASQIPPRGGQGVAKRREQNLQTLGRGKGYASLADTLSRLDPAQPLVRKEEP